MTDLFDAEAMYDDYLYFLAPPQDARPETQGVQDARTAADIEVIWRLLDVQPGMAVLDVGCGDGRIANQLAARGCLMTGMDSSTVFLDRAATDAATLGVNVDYVHGDMRELPWTDRFDRVISWSTAFGYFDDTVNREVLGQIHGALRADGRLAMDLNNLFWRVRSYQPSGVTAQRPGGDMLVDRRHFDPLTARLEVERTAVRAGRARHLRFVVRLFAYPEIRDWLRATGFSEVGGYGEDGRALTSEHERMIVVAQR